MRVTTFKEGNSDKTCRKRELGGLGHAAYVQRACAGAAGDSGVSDQANTTT